MAYRERTRQSTKPDGGDQGGTVLPGGGGGDEDARNPPKPGEGKGLDRLIHPSTQKQFYGAVSLDPVRAKMDFAAIMDEVVQQFTAQLGVEVTISVEIEARSKAGFDDGLQRTVKENCNVLGFRNSEFEEGE